MYNNRGYGGGGGGYGRYQYPSVPSNKPKIIHVDPSIVQKTKPTVNSTVQDVIQRRQLKYPIPIVNIPIGKAPPEAGENPNPLDYSILIDMKTTVVIEDLNADTENDYIKKLLESCGPYISWKRLKDAQTNRWKTFGFCEYVSCASAIRAMRLLNGLEIEPDVVIKVKCGKKIQQFMDQYQQKRMELWSQRLREREDQMDTPSSATSSGFGNDQMTPEQKQFLAQLEQQMGTVNESGPQHIEVRDADRKEFENFENSVDQISQIIIRDLVNERMNIEKENRSRESISQQLAVSNTVLKISETGVSNEEAERKKEMISDEIRRFRDNERIKEEEIKENERRIKEKIYREKRLKQSKQLDRERRRRLRWEKENEEDRCERDRIIRAIESFERKRERKYGGVDGTGEGYITSDEEMEGSEKKKIQIELQEKAATTRERTDIMVMDEDQEAWSDRKKKKLSAVEEIERSKQQAEYLDRSNIAKLLPTSASELYKYAMDWNIVDKFSLWEHLRSFVNDKVVNLMGGPEDSLNQFILGKIETHSEPQNIIEDLAEVFDEQTDALVFELWQMLLIEMIRKQRELEIEKEDENTDFQ